MAHEWGRKETIVWPPHMPVYTYGALFLTFWASLFFLWSWYYVIQSPLQQRYTMTYVETGTGALFDFHGKYRLLYLGGAKPPRLAVAGDFEKGQTPMPGGSVFPMQLTKAAREAGFNGFYFAPKQGYSDVSLNRWLQVAFFEGRGLVRLYAVPIGETVTLLSILLFFAVRADGKRFRGLKYGRRLKGPMLLTPQEFNREVGGTGIGFTTTSMRKRMRIPFEHEAQHILLMGDTGTGKTTLIKQILKQIEERGESAIVYDPACEYIQCFYDKDREDIVLNPLDARCPYWGPAEELLRNAEADAIAESLYQPTTDTKDEFFHQTPAQIFAHLLKEGPTPHELAHWMANPEEIEKRVAGTEMAHYIGQKAGPQRAGVLSSLGLVAKSFRLLPTKEQAGNKTWSATRWSETRKGWIFITSKPSERAALRPLHSLWIDLLVMRLLSAPQPNQKPVWFVIDELASLQRLPQLHTAITENRKSKNPLVLGLQGKSQAEVTYGHLAEVMLSQPATTIFMRTSEPKAAEWVSNALGKVEIERLKETKFDGSRAGKNFTLDRQIEPLVMDSEIEGLADKHAYLKLGNYVAHFAFTYMELPQNTEGYIPRKVKEDELSFDPLTLKKKVRPDMVTTQTKQEQPAAGAPLPQDEERTVEDKEKQSGPSPARTYTAIYTKAEPIPIRARTAAKPSGEATEPAAATQVDPALSAHKKPEQTPTTQKAASAGPPATETNRTLPTTTYSTVFFKKQTTATVLSADPKPPAKVSERIADAEGSEMAAAQPDTPAAVPVDEDVPEAVIAEEHSDDDNHIQITTAVQLGDA